MIKKTNAVFSLLTVIFFTAHMWIMTYALFTGWYHYLFCHLLAYLVCGAFSVHAVLSVGVFFFCHDGTDLSCKKANIGTIMQRTTAIMMLLLIHSHAQAYGFIAAGTVPTASQAIVTVILELLFLLAVCLHSSQSFAKALITLGILKKEQLRVGLTGILSAVYAITGITAAVAVIRFFAVLL